VEGAATHEEDTAGARQYTCVPRSRRHAVFSGNRHAEPLACDCTEHINRLVTTALDQG
jgi:hypothetical protein